MKRHRHKLEFLWASLNLYEDCSVKCRSNLIIMSNRRMLQTKLQLTQTYHRAASCSGLMLSGRSGWDETWRHQGPADPDQYRTSSTGRALTCTEKQRQGEWMLIKLITEVSIIFPTVSLNLDFRKAPLITVWSCWSWCSFIIVSLNIQITIIILHKKTEDNLGLGS